MAGTNQMERIPLKKKRIIEKLCRRKGYLEATSLRYLSPFCKNKAIYKYMNLDYALMCLSKNLIRFAMPTKWADSYESRFYVADYSKISRDINNNPKLYACCFTLNKTSEAAWNMYSYNKKGLGSICVQFKIDIKRLRTLLNSYASSQGMIVYESKICYGFSDEEINGLHKRSSPYYELFFDEFSLDSYLSLLSVKRNAFYYENEIRYFLIPTHEKDDEKIDVPVKWGEIIKEIFIDKDATDTEIEVLKRYCKNVGIEVVNDNRKGIHIKKFNLYKTTKRRVQINP